MTNSSQAQSLSSAKYQEQILVVPRAQLFKNISPWHGLNTQNTHEVLSIITSHAQFHPRGLMEEDPTYKQIIPYGVFVYQNSYFLMQRSNSGSESRLKNKFTLGIGGHMRASDLQGSTLFDWIKREFYEEIDYNDQLNIKPLGILNDDTNAVGQVHLGIVLLLEGSSSTISIRSELAQGNLVIKQVLQEQQEYMETWSQLIIPYL